MAGIVHLSLDRQYANLHFDSWRLGSGMVKTTTTEPLPLSAFRIKDPDTSYVHARNYALHNGLQRCLKGCYLFLSGATGPELYRLDGDATSVRRVYSFPFPDASHPPLTADPPLMPTAVEVCTASPSETTCIFTSTGYGDLYMLTVTGSQDLAVCAGQPVFPLRMPVLESTRPFQLLTAMKHSNGRFIAVVWAAKSPMDGKPSFCEVYALVIKQPNEESNRDSPSCLIVEKVQLLKQTPLPPFGAVCNPRSLEFVVAVDPSLEKDEEDTEISVAERDSPREREASEHEEGTQVHEGVATGVTTSLDNGVNGGIAHGRFHSNTDDGNDAVSPRTLQAVAERFAHLTSEDVDAPPSLPQMQYADVFKESGPDGAGALGSEPACALLTYSLNNITNSSDKSLDTFHFVCSKRVVCQPHRLLGYQVVDGVLRLGLTDDVDCAVVEVQPASDGPGFEVKHVASVPALAYVAAGKIQRKFLLLSKRNGHVAAALVEAQQYAYLYGQTEANVAQGEQQVLDLGISGQGGVVGAALLPGDGDDSGSGCLVILAGNTVTCFRF